MSLPRLNPVEPPWYGPVCPVVGEGWHREVPPYPDHRRIFLLAAHPGEGLLTQPTAATQALQRELVFLLRVFGRLPVTDSATRSRAGVRKASGEETAGEFAPAVVSVYGDLASM